VFTVDVYDLCIAPAGTVVSADRTVPHARFSRWSQSVPEFIYDPNMAMVNILVPTAESVKYRHILRSLVANNRSVLLMGETGVGKTVLIHDLFGHSDSSSSAPAPAPAITSADSATGGALRRSGSTQEQTADTPEAVSSTISHEGPSIVFVPVMFCAGTTADGLQDLLESKLERKRKNLLGAPVGKKVILKPNPLEQISCSHTNSDVGLSFQFRWWSLWTT